MVRTAWLFRSRKGYLFRNGVLIMVGRSAGSLHIDQSSKNSMAEEGRAPNIKRYKRYLEHRDKLRHRHPDYVPLVCFPFSNDHTDMTKPFLSRVLVALLCAAIASCLPAGVSYGEKNARDISGANNTAGTVAMSTMASATAAAASASPTVPYASDDPNDILWTPFDSDDSFVPQPERGSLGASILGPQNIPLELQNADLLAPPTTDNGDV